MRDIKFRALKDDMSNCSFVYGQLVYDAVGQPRITAVDRSGQGLVFHTCLRNTESQYTGLKDNNGIDIYEGDIVKTDSSGIMKVCWREDMAMFVLRFEKGASLGMIKDCVVIGNIFETPELFHATTTTN